MIIKSKDGNGFQIKSHTKKNHIYPKVYPTKAAAQKRIDEMMRHSKDKK